MAPSRNEPSYITLSEAARHVGCSTDTIRREIARGNLKAVRLGRLIRIKPVDLERAMRPVSTVDGGNA